MMPFKPAPRLSIQSGGGIHGTHPKHFNYVRARYALLSHIKNQPKPADNVRRLFEILPASSAASAEASTGEAHSPKASTPAKAASGSDRTRGHCAMHRRQ